jgi:riboflavin synthase
MFTGLIEQVGRVAGLSPRESAWRLRVECGAWDEPLKPGDSVCVSGTCLTVTACDDGGFDADVLGETFRRTSFADRRPGGPVNLERAVRASGRLGGHLVTGHVDGVGTIESVRHAGPDRVLTVKCEPALLRQMVEKGSVACDGVSLTLTSVKDTTFDVHLIPFTWFHTSFAVLGVGERVNIETDPIAKHVERQIEAYLARGTVTEALLRRSGFAG